MKYWLYAALLALALGGVVVGYGYSLPSVRSGTASQPCRSPAKVILATLLDVESQPRWRRSVASVQHEQGSANWTETSHRGYKISFHLLEANEQLVLLTFTGDKGYHGSWRGELAENVPGQTLVTVTEEVTVENPVARVLSRLFFDPQEFVDRYLNELCAEADKRATVQANH